MTPRWGHIGPLVAAAAAVLVVAGVAAGTGPLIGSTPARPLRFLPGRLSRPPTAGRTSGQVSLPRPPSVTRTHSSPLGTVVNAAVPILAAVALAVLLVIVLAAVLRQVRLAARIRAADGEPVVESATQTADEAVRRQLRAGVAAALAHLDESADPRQAVLGCWLRLEDVVARSGAARAPAETSAELARRVLTAYAVEPSRLDRLHRLYEAARYSIGQVPEQARDEARASLDSVRRDIDRGLTPATAAAAEAAP